MGLTPDSRGMEKWAQRERFQLALKAYQESTGKIHEDVAADLEITLPTLRNYLYGSKNPSTKVLQRAAGLFGCSVTEFIDDPGTPVPFGVNPQEWSEASERTRVLASAMFQDLRAMPEEEQQIYYELWKKGQEIGRARLAAEAKEKLQAESEPEKTKKPQRR